MSKKVFLSRHSTVPVNEQPSISVDRNYTQTVMSVRSTAGSERAEQLHFLILDETTKSFPTFNTTGRSLLIKFNSPGEQQERTSYLWECITGWNNYLVDEMPDRDLVGLTIRTIENTMDKPAGISLRRRDQLKPDVVWDVLGNSEQFTLWSNRPSRGSLRSC
jgi:hypothetical protein